MLFNSIEFAIFLPIVFFLYWFVINKNVQTQNILLLFASYIFYGWWDWRFLLLIIISSIIDYFVGVGLSEQNIPNKRKLLLFISICVNIGILGFFKYYNFFVDSFVNTFTLFGHNLNITTLNIILPVGISFYTFQTLSYSIDVYKNKFKPTKNIISFFAFVSFFPQLVAGPIERAINLLPQFEKKRRFDYLGAVDGLRQILWGLFKKIVIADTCAPYVNDIFKNYVNYSGSTLLLGAILFALQIYGDFSGYSDIAIGTARLFGFTLMRNFSFPYFSRDIAEFWRKWHISLSTWFRDYIYIPLGGSQGKTWVSVRNIFIIFGVSGFWHGASWTFIVWGFINACCFLPLLLLQQNRKNLNVVAEGRILPNVKEIIQVGTTFFIIVITWIFFRAESLYDAIAYLTKIFSISIFRIPQVFPIEIVPFIGLFILIEWLQRDKQHALQIETKNIPQVLRWGFYYALIFVILSFSGKQQEFIYFQF